jgi:hypothetical protein
MFWLWSTVSLGSPPFPPGPPPGPPPLPIEAIADRAGELGIAPDVVDDLRQLAIASRPAIEQAEDRLGVAEDRVRELRLDLELDVRAPLTPEQWDAVRPPPPSGGNRSRSVDQVPAQFASITSARTSSASGPRGSVGSGPASFQPWASPLATNAFTAAT